MLTSSISSGALQSLSQTSSSTGTDLLSNIGDSFADVLQSLTESQQETDSLTAQLSSGEDIDVHTVMLAMTENDINFRVAMAIRNKLVDAYHEVTRMSI